jgi:hypothetical protein
MQTKLTTMAVACVLGLGLVAPSAWGDTLINPSVGNCGLPVCLVTSGTQTSNPQILSAVALAVGAQTQLYKADSGNTVVEDLNMPFANYYTTEYIGSGGDYSGAKITWDGPNFISANPVYAIVKDGNQDPAWYLFNISGWNGKDTLEFSGFWPQSGSISHIEIQGTPGTVPDGGMTLMLLGGALVGLETLRRKFRA